MKHNRAFTAAFVAAPEVPAREAQASVRGRNAKMDQFLRKVNGSPRFAFGAAATAVNEAMVKVKAKA
jgi:hypothetical protein